MKIKHGEATKKDHDKPSMALLPPSALYGIAGVFSYGEQKYHAYNYKSGKGLDWDRPFSACLRHLVAWNEGEEDDRESGKSHLFHAGCCIMMLIDLVENGIGKDTRFTR